MLINLKNNISFGKKLIATCCVKKNKNKQVNCNIFELNKKEDSDYFEKVERKKTWEFNTYLHEADFALNEEFPAEKIYSIETRKKECLGYILIEETEKSADIGLLETCPIHSFKNKERDIKYIGETLITFCTELAKRHNLGKICVPIMSSKAKMFYLDNCNFVFSNEEGAILHSSKFDSIIEQNEMHTGCKINFFE